MIREKNFSFIAVERDWPDCYRLNRYVKGYPESGSSAHEVLHADETEALHPLHIQPEMSEPPETYPWGV